MISNIYHNPSNNFQTKRLYKQPQTAFRMKSGSRCRRDMQVDGIKNFLEQLARARQNNSMNLPGFLKMGVLEQAIIDLIADSRRDALTGLPNRKAFGPYKDIVWSSLSRAGVPTPVSLLIVDADHFGMVNKLISMDQGDLNLKSIVKILKQHIHRKNDMVARWGGEEFYILLPGACINSATSIAELLRKSVEQANIVHPQSNCQTISIGVATFFPDEDNDFNSLADEADKALTHAKRTRNTVSIAIENQFFTYREVVDFHKQQEVEAIIQSRLFDNKPIVQCPEFDYLFQEFPDLTLATLIFSLPGCERDNPSMRTNLHYLLSVLKSAAAEEGAMQMTLSDIYLQSLIKNKYPN